MQKIVFTDLDGTLTLRDTYHIFLSHNITASLFFKNASQILLMLAKYFAGAISKEGLKRSSFKLFFTNYDTTKELQSFVAKIPWNKSVLERVNAKKHEGYRVILVSASPDVYLDAVVKELGYDGYLATKTLRKGELLEGSFDGAVCNFDEKKRRILEFLNGVKPEHTLSFGNSKGDFAMLSFCDESYFVKGSSIKPFGV